MPHLGAHMSIAGGLDRAIERGRAIGCDAIQIFLKNNLQWTAPPYDPDEIRRFRNAVAGSELVVFAHTSYLLNPASPHPRLRQRSLEALIDELRRAAQLGLPFLVLHPGAHQGAGPAVGLRHAVETIDAALRTTRRSRVRIALETTAGQGTCLGGCFEELAAIIRHSRHPDRLAVCVDTCHIFAAGYDIRTPATYATVARQLDALPVVAFHLNDSKHPLGSRRDRHEHIGRGHLGRDAFRCLLNDTRWQRLPMTLETPKGADLRDDRANLRRLRQLMAS